MLSCSFVHKQYGMLAKSCHKKIFKYYSLLLKLIFVVLFVFRVTKRNENKFLIKLITSVTITNEMVVYVVTEAYNPL